MSAEIVTGQFCSSYFGTYEVVGSKGDIYNVTWNLLSAHCQRKNGTSCPAYHFSKDQSCKHIREVWNRACMWNCQWFKGNEAIYQFPKIMIEPVIIDFHCPNCSGACVAVKVAV
jgi:hypothetical protein